MGSTSGFRDTQKNGSVWLAPVATTAILRISKQSSTLVVIRPQSYDSVAPCGQHRRLRKKQILTARAASTHDVDSVRATVHRDVLIDTLSVETISGPKKIVHSCSYEHGALQGIITS